MKVASVYERHHEKQVFFGVEDVLKLNEKWMIAFLHNLFLLEGPYDKIVFNQQTFTELLNCTYLASAFEFTLEYAPKNTLVNKSLNLKVRDF